MADNKLISANINEEEGIAWLTLNRPEKKNALSIALLNELVGILRSLADNDKIRCIVTRGRAILTLRDAISMTCAVTKPTGDAAGGAMAVWLRSFGSCATFLKSPSQRLRVGASAGDWP